MLSRRCRLISCTVFWSAALLLCGTGVQAQAIVDATQVQDALKRGVQVWDVRDARDFARGHLPGAITIGDAARVLRDDNTEDFIAHARIEKLFSEAGLDPARETVIYG